MAFRQIPDRHRIGFCGRSLCRGYTLIEVLLTGTIVLIAMTGILTTQMVGIKITQNAYHRTQATTLAYQMTDYLRSNCGALSDYAGLTLCHAGNRGVNDDRGCTIDAEPEPHDSETTAEADLRSWWKAINDSQLPNWYSTVVRDVDTNLVSVVVQWDDTRATEGSSDIGEAEEEKKSCLGDAVPALMEEVCLTTLPCAL